MRVEWPGGIRWTVRRRVAPWRPRALDPWQFLSWTPDLPVDSVVLSLLVAVLTPLVVVAAILSSELLLLFFIVPFVVVGRMLLRRPWPVEVERRWGAERTVVRVELVHGWVEAGARVQELVAELERTRVEQCSRK